MKTGAAAGGRFVPAVLTLVSGKSAAALISLALTPFIARLFVPADFGVFAIIVALVQPLVVIGTLRLDLAVVIPAANEEAQAVFSAACGWLVVFSAALLGVGATLAAAGVTLPFADRIGVWLWAVPFALVLQGLCTLSSGWLTRDTAYGTMATAEITRAATTPVSRLGLGLATGTSVWGLAAGYFAGLLAQLGQQWRRLPGGVVAAVLRGGPAQRLQAIARWKDFPLLNAPRGLLLTLGQSLPVIAIGAIYTPAAAGLYAMAVRLIGGPGNMIAMSVRRVFLQRIARQVDSGSDLRAAWLRTTGGMLLLGIAPFLLLWQFGTELLTLFLGADWSAAGAYAELIAVLLLTQWLAVPANAVIVVLRRQSRLLAIEVMVVIGQVVVLLEAAEAGLEPLELVGWLVAMRVVADVLTLLLGATVVWRRRPVD